MSPENRANSSEVVDVIALAAMSGGAASDYSPPMPGGMGSSPPGGMGLERDQSGLWIKDRKAMS